MLFGIGRCRFPVNLIVGFSDFSVTVVSLLPARSVLVVSPSGSACGFVAWLSPTDRFLFDVERAMLSLSPVDFRVFLWVRTCDALVVGYLTA
jgi:hypothetical protein